MVGDILGHQNYDDVDEGVLNKKGISYDWN
jgi:hypothetical protein